MEPQYLDRFPAERVLWTGSPVRHPGPDVTDLVMLGMGLFALLFGGVWVSMALYSGAPLLFVPFGFLVVVIGLVQSWGSVAFRHLALREVVYTVTDKRVVIVTTVLGRRKEESSYLADLRAPVVKERPDGVGTITFGTANPFVPRSTRFSMSWTIVRPTALCEIDDVRHVRDLIVSHRDPNRAA